MTLKVSVVSAERELWTGDASQVVARTLYGEIGILTGHEPVLAILAPGESRITASDGTRVVARVEDGFLSVQGNAVTIVAGRAELV
ncbi:MAG: F0F1 ATP synthase subunit epsilon [Leifsonia xyli]|nr:MAG: F0F1 ATP synthase subunit epsilon [Leifsonia xyli]